MTRIQDYFLTALCRAVRGLPADDPTFSDREWDELLRLAREQELLPLVYNAVCQCSSFQNLDTGKRDAYQNTALTAATRQTVQTNAFLDLLLAAQTEGLDPVVLKGLSVRELYPLPVLRPSVDEDLLIPPEQAEAYHRFLLAQGLVSDDPGADVPTAWELGYHRPDSPTGIELHMSPLPPDSEAYGELNALFEGLSDRAEEITVEGVPMRVPAPTDHILYMLCHIYKHFLHSGFGVRQVCDIGMLAAHAGEAVDWPDIRRRCARVRLDRFAAAVLRVGDKYLGFPLPEAFADLEADPELLVEDILSAGVYGMEDEAQKHSGTVVLDAVAARNEGRSRRSLLAAAFPPASSLQGRYGFLRGKPWLLPAAWTLRFGEYLFSGKARPAASMRAAEHRLRLLREYGIID